MSKYVIAINGSYRKGAITDTAVNCFMEGAVQSGADTEIIYLRDRHIEFCTNCRTCMQTPGSKRGACSIQDDMNTILDKIEKADLIVLASPVNFYQVTAIFKRFMERLACYGYWPWEVRKGPEMRNKKLTKKAVIITSSGAPTFIGRLFFRSVFSSLKAIAKVLGAKVVKTIYTGMVMDKSNEALSDNRRQQIYHLGKTMADHR